jgi:hypothetical protein
MQHQGHGNMQCYNHGDVHGYGHGEMQHHNNGDIQHPRDWGMQHQGIFIARGFMGTWSTRVRVKGPRRYEGPGSWGWVPVSLGTRGYAGSWRYVSLGSRVYAAPESPVYASLV